MHRSDNPLTVKDVARLVASFFRERTSDHDTPTHGTITHGGSTFKVTVRYVRSVTSSWISTTIVSSYTSTERK